MNNIIQFNHAVSGSEVRSFYLNLKDDEGNQYGDYFPPDRTKFVIIDDKDRKTSASKRGKGQLWGNLRQWFEHNNIKAGSIISIEYDPDFLDGERHVIRISLKSENSLEGSEEEAVSKIQTSSPSVQTEIPIEFEKHLENFLEKNLHLIGDELKLYEDEDGKDGRQYPTDVGIVDLLCRDKTGGFVVIELKKGQVSDKVVGQVLRYVGWVKEKVAQNESVRGIILSHEHDQKLEYAIKGSNELEIQYYKINMSFVSEDEIKSQ